MISRRRKIVLSAIDHTLEALEGRSQLSAAPIADAAFLNAGSDPVPQGSAIYDLDHTPVAPAGQTAAADLGSGAVSSAHHAPPGFTGYAQPPVEATYVAPAEYQPIAVDPVTDPVVADPAVDAAAQQPAPAPPMPTYSAPAPADAPSTPAAVEERSADQTPVAVAPAVATAAVADTTFVWIDSSESWLLTTKSHVADQVVIASTFFGH